MDRRKVKVLNMENPGEDITVNLNGELFIIQHGATVPLPGGVIEVLNNAQITRHKRTVKGVETNGGLFQRFEVMEYELPEEEGTPKQKKRGKLADDLDEK